MSDCMVPGPALSDPVGDTVVIEVDFKTDMTGWEFASQWRTWPSSDDVAATPTIDTSDAANHIVRFIVDADTAEALGLGRWYWDVLRWDPADPPSSSVRWPWGTIQLTPNVTREVTP